jgi:hypothetical protein
MSRKRAAISPQDRFAFESRYGPLRDVRYPHEAAAYEDKLEDKEDGIPTHSRATCRPCRAFASPEHIIEHSTVPTTTSVQKERAAKNTGKNVISEAQFTLNFDEEK